MVKTPVLIVLGGLPGVGKTTIAREIVKRSPFAYLRIDVIEQALRVVGHQDVGPTGYVISYELAKSNLSSGTNVVADCVNPLTLTRNTWRSVAAGGAFKCLEVEVVCSDLTKHRDRVEGRNADIPAFKLPTWDDVQRIEYEEWITPHLVIDTALMSPGDAASLILEGAMR